MTWVQRSTVATSLAILAVVTSASNAPAASSPPLHAAPAVVTSASNAPAVPSPPLHATPAVQACFTTMIVDGDNMPSGFQGHYGSITDALEARSLRAHFDLDALQGWKSQYTDEDRQSVAAFAAQVPAWDALLKAPDTLMAVDASGTLIAKASVYVDQEGHHDVGELIYRDPSRESAQGCTPQVLPPSEMVAFLPVVPARSFGHDNIGAPSVPSELGLLTV